ncbi:DUF6636 domain-containing protein [Deinococcus roseus]|uniref:Uncharacterized protein n=1 Tax=Deinococcus roseus TaxID=392414 RepID=A0ABQ2CWZ6_9DEIO|nr:DUF6636 domain-containing protein [Deinococcus roseus]GGJ25341.1 hypothetical protein GCM10008938_09200 [Deinococcus roseus]
MKILLSLMLALLGCSFAQNLQGFQTPSGNIHCMLFDSELRCDLGTITARVPPRPKDCELDWGNAFGMSLKGKAQRICHGDTVMNPNYPVLQYGKTWKKAGFVCTSLSSGLSCTNKDKHGWVLSKGRQVIF